MSDIVIRAENLGKLYKIGEYKGNYKTLGDAIVKIFSAPIRQLFRNPQSSNPNPQPDTIWALKNVSFEVKNGEVVGIIGRNGAGKTTLLKILSRITEPTEGWTEIRGRVGSLLEVGTGFHPELTGRENIYLNGAILGMKKGELNRKFDEIVAFAEIEKFIDTPVKRYSSGMYVRLAFAVAAHLDPEILLVDEVLAVGDAAFQKKCLGKMGDVAGEGRTVLFVSHNMVGVQSLCQRVIWLNDGEIVQEGQPSQVVSNYLQYSSMGEKTEQVWNDIATAPGNDLVRLRRVSVRLEGDSASDPITMQSPFLIEVEYWNLVPDSCLHITLHLYTGQGIVAFTTGSAIDSWRGRPLQTGLYRSVCHIPGNLMNTGRYRIVVFIVKDLSRIVYRYEDAVSFDVVDLADRGKSWYGKEPGVVHPLLKWKTEYVGTVSNAPSLTEGGF